MSPGPLERDVGRRDITLEFVVSEPFPPGAPTDPPNARFSHRRSRAAESRSWAAAAASLAPHPVGRPPLEIHHRQNADAAWLDLVEKRVGKSAEEPTTNGTTEDHPGFGLVLNGLQAPVNLLEEGRSQPRVLEIVVLRRLVQLSIGESVEFRSSHSFQLGPSVPKHVGCWTGRTGR